MQLAKFLMKNLLKNCIEHTMSYLSFDGGGEALFSILVFDFFIIMGLDMDLFKFIFHTIF